VCMFHGFTHFSNLSRTDKTAQTCITKSFITVPTNEHTLKYHNNVL